MACRPDTVLIIGCHIGYCVLRILRCIPKDAVVLVIEKNMDYLTAAKQLVSMVGTPNNVSVSKNKENSIALFQNVY